MKLLENVFAAILNMSTTASVAAVLIVVFRWIFGNKLPKVFNYALWVIVLVRLLIPFSLPSVFSIFNAIPASEIVMTKSPEYNMVNNSSLNGTYYGIAGQKENVNDVLNNNERNSSLTGGTTETSVDHMQVLILVLAWIWLAVMATLFSFNTFAYFRTSNQLKESVLYKNSYLLAECSRNLKMMRKVKIFSSDRIDTPIVCGLIKTRIILPLELALSSNELELKHIITHELIHIKRFDYIIKLLSILALCIHWFNPVIWLAFILSQKDMEMSCDERVISVYGDEIRCGYAESLIKLAAKQNALLNGGLLAFGESNIKSRINGIMNRKKPKFWISATAAVIFIAFGLVLLTNGQYKDEYKNVIRKKAVEDTNSGSRFAIYLVKNSRTKTAAETDINSLELENTPIISDKDIKLYKWPAHSFELNSDVLDKAPSIPVAGLPFVVIADGERIYVGAFWTSFSSISTGLPIINILEKPLAISLGYPVEPEDGIDPRNDNRIYNALKEAGILALDGDTFETTNVNRDDLSSENDKQLWTKDGWTYFLEQIPRGGSIPLNNYVGRLYRQNDGGAREILDELVKYTDGEAVVFPAGDRIVFIGFAGTDVMDFKITTIISIKQDGSDRRAYNTKYNVARQLCYDNGYLYYEGWTNDGAFPRPLCRIGTDLNRDIKIADIDGSLITVYNGCAYYLNSSIYKLKLDWVSKPEIFDKAAIGKNILSVQKKADDEFNVYYNEMEKPYILRLTKDKKDAFGTGLEYFDAFAAADCKRMSVLPMWCF